MTYKEEFLKTKLTDYCNQYKAVASLSILAIAKNDVVLIKKLHKDLKKIFDTTMSFLEPLCSKSIISKLKNMDLSLIPQSMESLKIIDSYQKILSLKYTKVETDNIEDKIYLNKMSIEFNPLEEIPYLNIARALYENENYSEAIELCEFIKTITDTAPVWSLIGDIYRTLKMYGKSIEAYKYYLKLNEDDDEATETLKEIYEEALS